MSRTTIGFLIGATFAFVGVMLALKASSLATNWQMIGPNAWGGTTDTGKEQAYRLIGVVAGVFGLVIIALCFQRWLRDGGAVPEQDYPNISIQRRRFFD